MSFYRTANPRSFRSSFYRGAFISAAQSLAPELLSNKQFWYKADNESYSNNDSVTSVTNLYGNTDLSQSDTNKAPLFKTNVANGKPGFLFDGSNDFLTAGDNFDLGTNDFSIFMVVSSTDNSKDFKRIVNKRGTGGPGAQAGYHIAFDDSPPDFDNVFVDDGNGNTLSFSGSNVSGFLDGNPHIISWLFENSTATLSLFVDGVEYTNVSTTGDLSGKDIQTTRDFTLGCAWDSSSSQNQFMDGYIFEVYGAFSLVSSAERQEQENYLASEYGVSI